MNTITKADFANMLGMTEKDINEFFADVRSNPAHLEWVIDGAVYNLTTSAKNFVEHLLAFIPEQQKEIVKGMAGFVPDPGDSAQVEAYGHNRGGLLIRTRLQTPSGEVIGLILSR